MYEAVGSTQLDSADINEIREATNEFINKPESWESVLVFLRWRLGGLLEIQLYPVSLNAGASYSARGRPVLCEPEQAEKILSNLESMSKPLGTTLQLQENVGIIRIADG